MVQDRIITSLARIEVEQHFCNNCSGCIKNELKQIDDVNNIRLYPKESLITFNFKRANKLSEVLNILSAIGYPEKGEVKLNTNFSNSICGC